MREQKKKVGTFVRLLCGVFAMAIALPAFAKGPDSVKLVVVDSVGNALTDAKIELRGPAVKLQQMLQVEKGTWVVQNPGDRIDVRVAHGRTIGSVEISFSEIDGPQAGYKIVLGPGGAVAQRVTSIGSAASSEASMKSPFVPHVRTSDAPPAHSRSAGGCVADFSLAAPFMTSDTTCGAGNDCGSGDGYRDSAEHIYEITLPNDGLWTFSLCGSSFDTFMYLSSGCCSGVITTNDDSCGLQSSISANLTAGVYYLNVEAFSSGTCGDYTLDVSKAASCVSDFSVVGPGTFMGNTCGAVNDCPLRASEEHIYEVELPNDGDWTFSLCGSAFDTFIFLGSDCCDSDIASNDDSCGTQSRVTANLTAGTYFVMVEAFGAAGCGDYTLDISKAPPPDDCSGDDCGSADAVAGLPFSDSGDTCGCTDNYDEICPFDAPGSPDKVYAYTPAQDECVEISLCGGSAYDTKLYVYENACGGFQSGTAIACNDDNCSTPNFPDAFVSRLANVALTGGNTYYIVVDGYDGECGSYTIDITPVACPEPCGECPMGGIPEDEPNCGLPEDSVNGGCLYPILPGGAIDCCSAGACTESQSCFDAVCACDSFCCTDWDSFCAGTGFGGSGCGAALLCPECAAEPEYRFSDISCGDTVCGTGAFDGALRDTDWYEITVTETTYFTWTVEANFAALIGLVETVPPGSGDCDTTTGVLNPFAISSDACETLSVTACLPPGTHWWFVAATFDNPVTCGTEYTATLECGECPTGACCPGDGSCIPDVTEPECLGEWHGPGSVCDPNPCPPPVCPGEGDCCIGNGTPGCDDEVCCNAVCACDSFCCDVEWDADCAGTGFFAGCGAQVLCEQCAVDACPGDGDCCEANGTPGCNDETCCETVCACDSFCCDFFWDVDCVDGSGGFGVPGCNSEALCDVCQPQPETGACCEELDCSIQTEADCDAVGGRYLGDNSSCVGLSGNPSVYSDLVNEAIPDGDPGNPIVRVINVPDSFILADLNVGLAIDHTWVGDLCVTLTHGATTVNLIQRMGAAGECHFEGPYGCGADNFDIVLDDEGAGGPIEAQCVGDLSSPPNYVPNNPLSAFAGMDAAGDWILEVSDNAGFDTGTLLEWSLILDVPGPNPCIPTGACCMWPDGCEVLTVEDCDAANGEYLGDDTACESIGEVEVYEADVNEAIPDGDPGNPLTHTINVPDSFTIQDVNIDLAVAHTWVGDLCVTVTHGATSVNLIQRMGAVGECHFEGPYGCGADDFDIVLDDQGTGGPIEAQCVGGLSSPPNYVPNNPLSVFNGMDSAGDWTVEVSDNAGFDTGTLLRWSVHLTRPGADPCEDVEFGGACCDAGTGNCTDDVLAGDCEGQQLTWYKNELCGELDPPCEQATGACCNGLTGVCTEDVLPGNCTGPQQVWTKLASCSQVSCVAALGACCDREMGACEEAVTQAQCSGEFQQWLKGGTCEEFDPPCEPDFTAIPTVSTWGMVVLMLMLLVLAKVYFGQRREGGGMVA